MLFNVTAHREVLITKLLVLRVVKLMMTQLKSLRNTNKTNGKSVVGSKT